MQPEQGPRTDTPSRLPREAYQREMLELRSAFGGGASGAMTIAGRTLAMDELVRTLWSEAAELHTKMVGVALIAVGGYGRKELFPFSDVDLLFLLDGKTAERDVKEPIRRVSQELWDLGIRVSPMTRTAAECLRFDPTTAEFTLSLLDHRLLAGNETVYARVFGPAGGLPRMLAREHRAVIKELEEITRARHAKYGETLFHLEPNIKECPGGLRDAHVCSWLGQLRAVANEAPPPSNGSSATEYQLALNFLVDVRCFLHFRHERDDNTLDWQAQDAAADGRIGMRPPSQPNGRAVDAAYWMRTYFRHARAVQRRLTQRLNLYATQPAGAVSRLRGFTLRRTAAQRSPSRHGYFIKDSQLALESTTTVHDPAYDPDVVLHAFAEMAASGVTLTAETEERLSSALPLLSAHLEEGAALWHPLRAILRGACSGRALRAMHAIGMLELLVPEFHGIDALVIRDAYHRYTVDEHTFVVLDTLHALENGPTPGSMAEWTGKFSEMLRDMAHPELLYLGALLHDTGKGRISGEHARESVAMAANVTARLELDPYERGLVLGLIEHHLEMSAALRRDIFDAETVRAFAGKTATPEELRMLTLFTYADISAVHPDAMTPWKAENLWRLYMATSNFLDRSVDDERVGVAQGGELIYRVTAAVPEVAGAIRIFLEGFPERYLRTRSPEQIRAHFFMATHFAQDPVQIHFRHGTALNEITLITRDRPLLFATVAGALAAWGMNIVTADAFSNRQGIVVDTLRFTDTFRTLEMNQSEHARFVESIHDVLTGKIPLDRLLSGRRRLRRKAPLTKVECRIEFDDQASSHSTLLQVVAQDAPGLLRTLSQTLAESGCNVEVALVDTEGETAIDVFYLTRGGAKLAIEEQQELRNSLARAMQSNEESI